MPNASRYCGDDIGRFAVNGQGHCHTMTSVMASFLYDEALHVAIELKKIGAESVSQVVIVLFVPDSAGILGSAFWGSICVIAVDILSVSIQPSRLVLACTTRLKDISGLSLVSGRVWQLSSVIYTVKMGAQRTWSSTGSESMKAESGLDAQK